MVSSGAPIKTLRRVAESALDQENIVDPDVIITSQTNNADNQPSKPVKSTTNPQTRNNSSQSSGPQKRTLSSAMSQPPAKKAKKAPSKPSKKKLPAPGKGQKQLTSFFRM